LFFLSFKELFPCFLHHRGSEEVRIIVTKLFTSTKFSHYLFLLLKRDPFIDPSKRTALFASLQLRNSEEARIIGSKKFASTLY
jgi:hypothetical protein